MGSHNDHHDCGGYDFDNSWEYEAEKSHRPRRRHGKKRHEDCWSYGTW